MIIKCDNCGATKECAFKDGLKYRECPLCGTSLYSTVDLIIYYILKFLMEIKLIKETMLVKSKDIKVFTIDTSKLRK